eukprot:856040-Alexandrium_andersonii.AAC.1
MELALGAPEGQAGLSIAGGNLGVVRYAAGAGRLRRPALCVILERPLSDLAAWGLRVTWQAARRRYKPGGRRRCHACCGLGGAAAGCWTSAAGPGADPGLPVVAGTGAGRRPAT